MYLKISPKSTLLYALLRFLHTFLPLHQQEIKMDCLSDYTIKKTYKIYTQKI